MPVKILKAKQIGGFWLFEDQGLESIIENAPPLAKRRRLRYCTY